MGPSSFPDKKYTPLHDVSILFQIRWHCGVLSKLEMPIVCSILCVLLACQLQIKKLVMSIPPFLPVMVRPAQATSLVAATAVPVCRSTGALPVVTLRTFFPAATGKVWAWNPHETNLNDRLVFFYDFPYRLTIQYGSRDASCASGDLFRWRGVLI